MVLGSTYQLIGRDVYSPRDYHLMGWNVIGYSAEEYQLIVRNYAVMAEC